MASFLFSHTLETPPRPQQLCPPCRCQKPGVGGRGIRPLPTLPPSLGSPFPLQVRIWEIPEGGLKRSMTEALLELHGHSRRVGLVEWHPTTNNILFSAGYDYKVGSPAGSVDGEGERTACLGACSSIVSHPLIYSFATHYGASFMHPVIPGAHRGWKHPYCLP